MKQRTVKSIWLLLSVAAALWLLATTTDDPSRRLFFGLWRTRDVLVAGVLIYGGLFVLTAALSRRAAFAYLLATIMLLVSVGALELLGVAGIVNYAAIGGGAAEEVLGQQAIPHLDVTGETYQDLALRYGLSTTPIPFRYATDRRGFRNAADRADADLYLVGDSILVAGLLPIEQTVTSLLADRLGIRTMNLALIGLSPQQERDLFLSAALPTDGRMVIQFIFEGNDLLDSAAYRNPQANRRSPLQSTFCYNLVLRLQKMTDHRQLADERKLGRIAGEDYLFYWTDQSFRGVETEFEHIAAALLDMQAKVTAANGRFAIALVPAKIRVLGPFCQWPAESTIQDHSSHLSPLRAQLTQWCHDRQVAMLDLTDPLTESARQGQIPWFPADTHPNAIGHRVMAEAIANWSFVKAWRASAVRP